jgi:hypothetical protein
MGICNNTRVSDLSEFDLTAPKLGYGNFRQGAAFVQRLPGRYHKQGFRHQFLNYRGPIKLGPSWNQEYSSFINIIRGRYPKFGSVIDRIVNEEVISGAFSRKFALQRANKNHKFTLVYKGRDVGVLDISKDKMELSEKYNFLDETLQEELK